MCGISVVKMGLLEQHFMFGFEVGCLESDEGELGCTIMYRGLGAE